MLNSFPLNETDVVTIGNLTPPGVTGVTPWCRYTIDQMTDGYWSESWCAAFDKERALGILGIPHQRFLGVRSHLYVRCTGLLPDERSFQQRLSDLIVLCFRLIDSFLKASIFLFLVVPSLSGDAQL